MRSRWGYFSVRRLSELDGIFPSRQVAEAKKIVPN